MPSIRNNVFLHFGTSHEQISDITSSFGLISLIILDQVHGIDGHIITERNASMPFKSEVGDFIITNQRNVGLGVLTADCLPIIFIDNVTRAVGIAHAGWRGSVKNIALITLECMRQQYGTKIVDISVFFGPCAKVCCYEVCSQFKENCAVGCEFFEQRVNKTFFDLLLFNKSLLIAAGLPQTAINEQHNCCTICNDVYFSYRRQGDAAGRQVSVVVIK